MMTINEMANNVVRTFGFEAEETIFFFRAIERCKDEKVISTMYELLTKYCI